ncbi:sigma-70 family RNA polymerase sigma factor [Lapidilactobacillus luobeiensis]|uniref:sigma-70 family RNA polymerase sigma factor n=1 Tax=Lapidilactobacillus luobeiensis TaxID=2950371 RepID=UPI0021C30536|nr:sigma-70 family RNA polymerase sigma factor [Lapidilactobacillus luobeiensis]
MSFNQEEFELITAVQENGDSQALEALLTKYQPMIQNVSRQYYLRLFGPDEWQQEARIVCYQTCLLYCTHHDCQFGAFFKLRFHNHIRSLVRRELALKRRADTESVSYDSKLGEDFLNYDWRGTATFPQALFWDFPKFLDSLSYFELQAFRVAVHDAESQTTCQRLGCTPKQLERGIDRCRVKLKRFLT